MGLLYLCVEASIWNIQPEIIMSKLRKLCKDFTGKQIGKTPSMPQPPEIKSEAVKSVNQTKNRILKRRKKGGRPRRGSGGCDPSQGGMMSNTRVSETWMPWMFRRYCTCQKKLSSSFPCYGMWKRTKHASSSIKFREALTAPKTQRSQACGMPTHADIHLQRLYIHTQSWFKSSKGFPDMQEEMRRRGI